MYAEFQFPSPLVATRECYFLRFCSQQGGDGIWMVVDFPLDGLHDPIVQSASATNSLFPRYRRRPSGIVVQDLPNGFSKVTPAATFAFIFYLPFYDLENLIARS